MLAMTRWSKSVIFAAFTIGLLMVGPCCSLFNPAFAGGPYKGRVIDAETKQPLEGAAVLAVWDRIIPTIADRVDVFLDAEEVLTDSNGRFVVGKHPPTTFGFGWAEGPRITIYHPGYDFYPNYHVSPPKPFIGSDELLERMEKAELTFELPRLTREERLYSILSGDVNDMDVPDEKKRNLLRLRNIERKTLGLPGDDERGRVDTLILMNHAPDEKTLNLLRRQYKRILINRNGRYFNLDGTSSGIVYEFDLPAWARELLRRINYTFNLQTQLSEKPKHLRKNDYLPFCMKGKGSVIRTPNPVAKMHELFRSNGWKANDRYVSDGHGSSSLVYENEKYYCRILVEIDEVGTVPRKFGFEIWFRERDQN